MEQKDDDIDVRLDERRNKVRRWLGEQATSFALIDNLETREDTDSFEVREYQLDAWANLWEARERGDNRGLIHLATGLGKTSVAVFDVIKFREEQMAQDPPVVPRILFVSHRNEISEQAQETFQYFMPDAETAFFQTRQRNLPDADITFATFQSLHSQLHRFDPQDYEYVIYDEAHHSEAKTFKAVREHFDPLFELALTATPDRLDALNIREYFGEALYSKSLPEAIAEGWLVDVDYHIVSDEAVREAMASNFDLKTLNELKRLFMVRPRNEIIAKNVREERHKIGLDNAKTMVFCDSVEHTDEIASLLGGVAYHSGIEKDERNRILRNFRTGSTQVICTVDMFNEGIDIPDARLVVFLRSTQSPNIFEQQLGRGLRRAPGKDQVSVLDFVANVERIAKVRELSQQIRNASSNGGTGGEPGSKGRGAAVCLGPDGDGNETAGTGGGLNIHTAHGEFEFDRLAVDLLEKWTRLKESGANPLNTLSDAELIELADRIAPGRILTQREIDTLSAEKKFVSYAQIKERFGTGTQFNRFRGLNTKEKGQYSHLTNDELVTLSLELYPGKKVTKRIIEELSKKGLFGSDGFIANRFGSLEEFNEARGFPRDKFISYTSEQLITLAHEIAPGQKLTKRQIALLHQAGKFAGIATIESVFGSLPAFQEACGFTPNKKPR